jgi:SAM-dependent methyltransferase
MLKVHSEIKPSKTLTEILRCPICKSNLQASNDRFFCTHPECNGNFPVIDNVPVLINERNSLFSISDFTAGRTTTIKPESKLVKLVRRLIPDISHNVKAKANYTNFIETVLRRNPNPKVLVIGGSILGMGLDSILANPAIEFIEADVTFGGRTNLICDGHDLPFADGSIDGVIIQAVLEHVLDPHRCVEEIHRVLKADGLIYAETPFMQQVHMGRFDFHRFTHLGHRRLFRHFREIESGAMCGTGMALAWSIEYFLLSFVKTTAARAVVRGFTRVAFFWLKYFDYLTINKSGSYDAASGYYFMGAKSLQILSDKELIEQYRGSMQ